MTPKKLHLPKKCNFKKMPKMPRNARILISFKELEWLGKNEKMKKLHLPKKM